MDGLIVLSTEHAFTWFEAILLTIGICGCLTCLVVAFAMFDELVQISGFFFGLSIICLIFCFRIPKSEIRYKVMINDKVSFNELSERYRVVKIDGKIITIVEKEHDDD